LVFSRLIKLNKENPDLVGEVYIISSYIIWVKSMAAAEAVAQVAINKIQEPAPVLRREKSRRGKSGIDSSATPRKPHEALQVSGTSGRRTPSSSVSATVSSPGRGEQGKISSPGRSSQRSLQQAKQEIEEEGVFGAEIGEEEIPEVLSIFRAAVAHYDRVLTKPELRELIQQVKAGGEKAEVAKTILIASVSPLIILLARRMVNLFGTLPRGMEFMDVVQTGMCAVSQAINIFNPDRGILFTSFAGKRALWAIQEMLGIGSSPVVAVNTYVLELDRQYRRLAQKLGRLPTPEELANALYESRKSRKRKPTKSPDPVDSRAVVLSKQAVRKSTLLTLAAYRAARQPPFYLDHSMDSSSDYWDAHDEPILAYEVTPDSQARDPAWVVGSRLREVILEMLKPGETLSREEWLVLAMRAEGMELAEIGKLLSHLPGYRGGHSRTAVANIIKRICTKFDSRALAELENLDKHHQTPWQASPRVKNGS
jgi:hypothetical protein